MVDLGTPALPTKKKAANEYRTSCKICRNGIYTNDEAEWGRGEYIGLVHAYCARTRGIATMPLPLTGGRPAVDDRQRAAVTSSGLTPRQAEVLQMRADGLAAGVIAERLHVSAMVVHNNLRNARMRLGADTLDDAIAIALRRGVVIRRDKP